MRVIVAHPGKQHSYRLAEALEEAGCLSWYITTVYDSKSSVLMKVIKHILGRSERIRAKGRSSQAIPQKKVKQFCELSGMIILAVLRIDKKRHIYGWYNEHVSKVFGRKVASFAIKQNADAVICYDASARYCFDYLKNKAPSIIRIIDNAAMNRYGMFKIYQELDDEYGILKDKTGFKSYLLDGNECYKYKAEALLADYHIVASSFSKYTLTTIGIDEKSIEVIPYGVFSKLIPKKNNYAINRKLRLLYVGEVSPQKGIYDLIRITKEFEDSIEIHIVGSGIERLSSDNQKTIREKTVFHGYLLQEDLFKLYSECDVFVFPTLGDGFGFVVIEAMAAGLPVICSSNSVGRDVIVDGENGFVYQAGDTSSLITHIRFFLDNQNEIGRMGLNAANSARVYTWDAYNKKVASFVRAICDR